MLPFASDNTAPVHPEVLAAMTEANTGYSPSYRSDPWTEKAAKLIQKTLRTQAKILFVPTGTGANVLGLKLLCQAHESVLCSDVAHIHTQETSAAEAIVRPLQNLRHL